MASQKAPSDIMTTGKVAKVLRIASRTASKILDQQIIPSWRIPTSNGKPGDRRALKSDVIKYMQEHNIPMDLL